MGNEESAFGAEDDGAAAGKFRASTNGVRDVGGDGLAAVIPGSGERLFSGNIVSGEGVLDFAVCGPAIAVDGSFAERDDLGGGGEAESVEPGVKEVAAHIAEGTRAESDAFAPVGRVELIFYEGTFFADAEPEIPVEGFGDGVGSFGEGCHAAPCFRVGAMDGNDITDAAFLEESDGGAIGAVRGELVAHLADELIFGGGVAKRAGFMDGAGEGFFAIDVKPKLHGRHGNGGVHVVGGSDEDGVEILCFFVEELAPIRVDGGLWEGLRDFIEAFGVDFGDGVEGDVLDIGHAGDVSPSASSRTEGGDAEVMGGGVTGSG